MYGYEVFHEDILDSLIRNVRNDTSQHAYIFEGERGGGSLEAASLFSASLVCERQNTAPCGGCNACILAKAESHPDIHRTAPLKDKKNISVEQIRELHKDAFLKPFENGKKVYIVTYGDDLNEQAQNAFLKLLEEPPEYVVFIILTENIESLLPTVRSRCEKIKFPPIAEERVLAWLKEKYPEKDNLEFFAKYSGGNKDKAKKLAEEKDFITIRKGALEVLPKLLSSDYYEGYEAAEFAENNKDDAELIIKLWTDFVRDIMLFQNDGAKMFLNVDCYEKLSELASVYSDLRIVNALSALIKAAEMQRRYVSLHTLVLATAFEIKKTDD